MQVLPVMILPGKYAHSLFFTLKFEIEMSLAERLYENSIKLVSFTFRLEMPKPRVHKPFQAQMGLRVEF